jgi:hypothetical protein
MIAARRVLPSILLLFALAVPVGAIAPPARDGRFDALAIPDPSSSISTSVDTPEALPGFQAQAAAWREFTGKAGGMWNAHIDRRTGSPALVEGQGLSWMTPDAARAASVGQLAQKGRGFVMENSSLLKIAGAELKLNEAGSGQTDGDHWVLTFDRAVDGIPVEGERFAMYVVRGNLIAFGAERWGRVIGVPKARLSVDDARSALRTYMQLLPSDQALEPVPPQLVLLPVPAEGKGKGPYAGAVGAGIEYRLVWRVTTTVEGESGLWVGKVDAVSGEVLAFFDDIRYGQVKGGVFPLSNDGNCADFGCELAGFPIPYADVSTPAGGVTSGDMGVFTCTSGTAATTLVAPYIKIQSLCGAVSENGACTPCPGTLDLRSSTGTDCTIPSGDSLGNTHASRTAFYHLNRSKEKARYWLPSINILTQQTLTRVDQTPPPAPNDCNANFNSSDGSVNFYKSVAAKCRNGGQIATVLQHEFGHALDWADGGGFDNPSEAYADIVALMESHRSCLGRGFWSSMNCDGYGDACLSCSGIRDVDYDKHASHTPATPSNFVSPRCPPTAFGGGPCGFEPHCEGYVAAEALWDLATRDLPAAGLDAASAWQLAEKLWYKSRLGSGGNAYNCSLPNSDGCSASSWFMKLRVADDDNGNLANGTPHAAAIYAALNRHKIACGLATDSSNQNSSTCPSLSTPAVTVTSTFNGKLLSWSAVANASSYIILRNDISCSSSSNVIATVNAPSTSYTDTDLSVGQSVYYRVQARGSNAACDSPVSTCSTATTGSPVCGNGVLDGCEECDGADLGGASCTSLGCGGGGLTCNSSCQLVYTACTSCPACPATGGDGCGGMFCAPDTPSYTPTSNTVCSQGATNFGCHNGQKVNLSERGCRLLKPQGYCDGTGLETLVCR